MDLQSVTNVADVRQALTSAAWTYRSYLNDVNLVGGNPSTALALIFGEGVMTLRLEGDAVSGDLNMAAEYVMDLQGTLTQDADVPKLDMVGKERAGTPTDGWQYDYQAFLSPSWPAGVNQVPAFVGTIIRALPHNGKPAGVTASMILLANLASASGPE